MTNKDWIYHSEFIILFLCMIFGFHICGEKISEQLKTTDKLYEMFIDIVKERR